MLLLLLLGSLQLVGCATTKSTATAASKDRVIVVVGATSGFGKGVARVLADQGAHLVIAARRTQLVEELARECEQRGARVLAVTTDVSQASEVERLAAMTVSRFGRIDVWINNAGIGALGRFEDIPLEDHHRNGSYHAMRRFRAQQSGTLINIASVAGRVGLPYDASYSATKHAVVGLGAALNQELRLNGDRDIHVSTILPYAADTPWFQHAANYSGHEPRMVLIDPPGKVVDAIVRATVEPEPEVAVGYKAKAVVGAHRVGRRATERIAGWVTHDALIDDSPPAEPTSGSLYEPVLSGTGVSGGMR